MYLKFVVKCYVMYYFNLGPYAYSLESTFKGLLDCWILWLNLRKRVGGEARPILVGWEDKTVFVVVILTLRGICVTKILSRNLLMD
ncbi:hypothetical protein VNO77_25578 [Canavalia gladiata]|uniref:Uncharacterized protein n=1 Tax=Canavalia gladiata TaxID=3824 RepID=A0AAN9QB18_CANGL